MTACSVAECEKPAQARGWCWTHYRRWYTTGSIELTPRIPQTDLPCAVEECDKNAKAKGYCDSHWRRDRLYGDARAVAPAPTVEERFWEKVDKTETCWLWKAAISDTGYGAFNAGDRLTNAHRFAYELVVGPIPEGLELDHLCRVRACCNPAHLEPVTHEENVRRGVSPGAQTLRTNRCQRGHDLLEHGRWVNRPGGKRTRYCGACANARRRGEL